MNSLFFTIIIPTYNSVNTLSKALESIIQQSYTDYEVLIIDGVSSDGTLRAAEAVNDSRIKIFSENDKGVYDAMNKGIKLSKGEWLYFLGSDDFFFDSDVLKKVATFIRGSNVDVVYGNVHIPKFDSIYDGEFNEIKIQQRNICHQSIFFRSAVFLRTGYFDLYFKILADWDHNLKWFFDDRLSKAYINVTIAEYSVEGLSSTTLDKSFVHLKQWRYLRANKRKLTLVFKLKSSYQVVKKLYARRRWRDLSKVVFEFPQFVFRFSLFR